MKSEDFGRHITGIKDFLQNELSQLRAGKASVSLVDGIKVMAYDGSDPMPINELGSITIPEPQSLLIAPWDKSILNKIEKAIRDSGKGLNPVNEGEQIRIPVPPITEERRKEMVKQISKIVEQAKIRVRNLRQDAIKAVEEQEDNGVISEDDMFRRKKEIETDVTLANKELEETGSQKESEIMTV